MDEDLKQPGANLDTRTEEEKKKDISFVELVASAAPVVWKEKKESEFRSFPMQNQDGSFSCVAQTIKKLALILLWLKEKVFVDFSATSIYINRSNKPGEGMIGVEAFDIWKNIGITLEALVPSQNMNDAKMDATKIEQYEKDIGAIFKITNHVGIPNGDMETVASVIQQTGKGVMTWFFFKSSEWSKKFPKVSDPNATAPNSLRHSVAAVDFGLIGGKKMVKIEDSSPFGGISERWVDESFFQKRNFFTRYPMTFRFEDSTNPTPTPSPVPVPGKPVYTFLKNLEFIPLDANGNISDLVKNEAQKLDVSKWQDILRYEGLFPVNVASTGYYGATTAKGTLAFQKKYKVSPDADLDALGGKNFGPKTRAVSNSLYGA